MKWKCLTIMGAAALLPLFSHAEGVADSIHGLQGTLDNIYNEMLPMCSQLIGVARGIAGFAALWYIAARVYRQIASAEPIDFYPLLKPFALGMAILMFPVVISVINEIMQPVVTATGNMVKNSDQAITKLLQQKEQALKNTAEWQMYTGDEGNGSEEKWYKYTHPDDPTGEDNHGFSRVSNAMKFWMDKQGYSFRNSVKQWMSGILEVVYESAALCINTIRTFYLIVLAILGPLVFGLSVFDGFQHTLTQWLARYLNVFLWLPVANIFGSILGKIQENMLKIDIAQVHEVSQTFFSSTDVAYLIFLLIGIAGYFCVPSVANYIVNAGGAGGLLNKVNTLTIQTTTTATNTTIAAGSYGAQQIGGLFNTGKFESDPNAGKGSNPSDSYQARRFSDKN